MRTREQEHWFRNITNDSSTEGGDLSRIDPWAPLITYLIHAGHRIEWRSNSSRQFLSCTVSVVQHEPWPRSSSSSPIWPNFKQIRSFFASPNFQDTFCLAMFWSFVVSGAVVVVVAVAAVAVTVAVVGAAPNVVSVVAVVVVVSSASKTATKLKRDSSSGYSFVNSLALLVSFSSQRAQREMM